MEALLKAYLDSKENYYCEPLVIRRFDTMIRDDETVYVVQVPNKCDYRGYDDVHVAISELLAFMWGRQCTLQ